MALKGIRVLEFVGLAPGPFCGMILSDFGARVVRIDRVPHNELDCLQDGKRSIALDLKSPQAKDVVRKLSKNSDVLIDPFRPGVMEKLGLGPDVLMKENSKLIYTRLTGYGQSGCLAERAGHDINYLALSGILSMLGRANEKPTAPINTLADFAGGGLLAALGICMAIIDRNNTGRGQVIDASMVEGAAYVGSWLMRSRSLPIWGAARGGNLLDSGCFYYDTYETKDGKFMSVGCLEPHFFAILIEGLELPELTQYVDYEEGRASLTKAFLTRTQAEWSKIFESSDACVAPVVDWEEVDRHPHNRFRNSFLRTDETDSKIVPRPAPVLSRTPGVSGATKPRRDESIDVLNILKAVGYSKRDILKLSEQGALLSPICASKL